MIRLWTTFSRRVPVRSALAATALATALILAACANQPSAYQPTAPAFAGAPVWRIPAERIDVETAPGVEQPAPAVAARLAALPGDVVRTWPKNRLETDPSSRGLAVYTIERAEASERYLPRKKGVTAAFTNNPEAEFTVAFAVNLQLFQGNGAGLGGARAEARVTATLPESADEDDRRKLWERLMKDAAARLDSELQKQIAVGLPTFVRAR